MHYLKPALTFEQQLELIIARGLIVRDRDRALHCLQRKGYFRLSAYFLPFKQRDHDGNYIDKFIPGSCFEDAILLYKFDADLRLLVIQAIDRVEIALRTSITYHLGQALGRFGYIDPNNFTPFVPSAGHGIPCSGFDHNQFLARINNDIGQSKEDFVRHYRAKYHLEPHLPI
jgi:abortive infection bacteriophage resistance protein